MTTPSLASVPSLDEIIDEGIMPSNDFEVDFDSINIGDFEEDDVRLVFCYVPHILSTKAGWSKDLINSKSKFVDKLRAASAFVGLSADFFEHSPKLRQKLLGMDNLDEFDLLGVFRNRIVHQGRRFEYSGIELREIWCFAQWLVEIFLFAMIGYQKEMNDRRKYTGWSGGSVNVPIDPKFNLSS